MTDEFIQKAFVIFCLVVIFTMLGVAVNKALALPTVFFSYSTGNCVAVDNYADTNFTCEDLPNRYYHSYVE